MSLRFICVEWRENLRCANVFMQFDQNLTETEFLKINVRKDALYIKELSNGMAIKLDGYFSLDASTLTNLTVDECTASFRLNIGNTNEFEAKPLKLPSKLKIAPKPLFEIGNGKETTIHCSNCKCILMSIDILVRTREFPSGAVDTSEFFCHAATDFKEILLPRLYDLYYGFHFIVVNIEHLETLTKERQGHLYCNRCLQYLGETLFNGKAAKLWGDVLKLRMDSGEDFTDVLAASTTAQFMQKIVDDCTDVTETLHSMHFVKVLIESTFPNRECKYLMIHILEKQLKILRNTTAFLNNSCHNNNNVQEVHLDDFRSFKLLYRFLEESEFGEDERSMPALLQFWQQDISIQTMKVSPKFFTNLVEELENNSQLVPEFYRYSKDEFKLSYVFYAD